MQGAFGVECRGYVIRSEIARDLDSAIDAVLAECALQSSLACSLVSPLVRLLAVEVRGSHPIETNCLPSRSRVLLISRQTEKQSEPGKV